MRRNAARKNNKSASGVKKHKKEEPLFVSLFNKKKYRSLAKTYHHEVLHLIIDLRSINVKIQRSTAICQYQFNTIYRRILLYDDLRFRDFDEHLYHYENYCFRAAAFRDKLIQFVNQGLKLGYGQKETQLFNRLVNHDICKETLIHTELKRFQEDPDLKSILTRRTHQSHSICYDPHSGYSPLFIPESLSIKSKGDLKKWQKFLTEESEKINKFTKAAMDISNKIMYKMNKYVGKR